MDRMEEYKALRDAPEELPPALDGAVARARARARRRRLWRRVSAPAGSVAAVFAAFVLLVNLSTPFALACGKVPVLKELAAAVAFSPSLKAAVENDYVQYIGQSATDNGITVHLEYLMADQGGLMLFLSVSGPEEATFFMPRATFTTPDGERLEGCSVLMDSVAPGELSNAITVAFNGEEESQLPESLRLTCISNDICSARRIISSAFCSPKRSCLKTPATAEAIAWISFECSISNLLTKQY